MPTKRTTNKLSQLYKTIDQKELSADAKKALADLRLATGNFRKQEGKEADAFMLFYNRLVNKKPTAVKTTKEYKAMLTERRRENGRKAMEARKAKQESRQGQGSERDAARPAKPFGWRLKGKHNYRKPTRADIRSGKAYYEARINRADTKRTKFPMLERGGYMAKGGEIHVVLNEGNGKIINKLFNDWNNVKTEKEYEKWVEQVRSTKFGTYGTITYDEVLRNFDFDNAPINSYHLKTFKAELKNALNKGYKYAKGGAIENQYEGREAEDIWNSLSVGQRLHFLTDHNEDLNLKFEQRRELSRLKFDSLSKKIQEEFAVHVVMGQYADGGYIESGEKLYEIANNMSDNEFQEGYRNLSEKEKDMYDSLLRLGDENKIALVTVLNESKKPKYDKSTWDLYTYANGGEVDKGGMIYALRNEISGGTIANKSGVDSYDDIAKVRRMAIQYYLDNGDVTYSLGELDRVLAMVGEEMGTTMAKGGAIKYSTYDNKSMEYIEGEIAHTERSARQFQQMGDYESMEDRQEHVKKLREIYNKKRAESKMAKGGVFYTDSHKQGH